MDSYEKIHCAKYQCNIENILLDEYIGEVIIRLYCNEGTYPHFHIENKDKSFECCVCIYEAKYFDHGIHGERRLNSQQRKQLDAFLRSKHKEPMIRGTYWEYIAFMWELNNEDIPGHRHYKTNKQPDYTKMSESVIGGTL